MRGILHHEDWGWSNAPRKGSNTSTTVQNNQPPPQFLAAYQQAVDQAQQVAATPYQQYPGTPQSLVAGFSPDQLQAMDIIRGSQGIADPYINAAAQYMSNATAPLKTSDFTNYLTSATGPGVTNAANTGVAGLQQANTLGQGLLADASQTGQNNILSASTSFTPGQINQWLSPYTQQVVDATQAQFNNQNAQAQAALRGNAASQGALGGDRLGVAQAELANQQQLAQAPTIANLYQQGYGQAIGAAGQQAQLATQGATSAGQLGAGMAQAGAQLGATTAQGAGTLGLQGATTNAQLQANAAQQIQAANQAQAWLNSQAGFGMGQLGQEALGTTMSGANALLGTGGMQQQLAQQYLNIPYEQFIAQQAYPFQTTGWFSNIAEGLGSAAGGTGTSTTTSPGPSGLSQVAGLGAAGLGLYGLGKSAGLFGSGASTAAASAPIASDLSSSITNSFAQDAAGNLLPAARGGGIRPQRALGGGMGDASTIVIPSGMGGIEDPSISFVPQGADPKHGSMNILHDFGSTTTSSGGGNGAAQAGQAIGDIATVAKVVSLFLNRGGRLNYADGGVPVPVLGGGTSSSGAVPQVTLQASGHGGPDVPMLNRIGGGSSAPSSSSGGSLNDYLNGVLGQIPTQDQLHPKPAANSNNQPAANNNDPLSQAMAAGDALNKQNFGKLFDPGNEKNLQIALLSGLPTFNNPRLVADRLATMAQSGVPGAQDAFMRYIGGGGFGGFGGGGTEGVGNDVAANAASDAANNEINSARGGRLGYADGGGVDDAPIEEDVASLVKRIDDAKKAMTAHSASLLERPSQLTNAPVGRTIGLGGTTRYDQPDVSPDAGPGYFAGQAALPLPSPPPPVTSADVSGVAPQRTPALGGRPEFSAEPEPEPPPPVTRDEIVRPEFTRASPTPYIAEKAGQLWNYLNKPAADPGAMNPRQMYGGTSDLPLSTDRDVLAEGHVDRTPQPPPPAIGGGIASGPAGPESLYGPTYGPNGGYGSAPQPGDFPPGGPTLGAPGMKVKPGTPGAPAVGGAGGRGATPPMDRHEEPASAPGAGPPSPITLATAASGDQSVQAAPGVTVSTGTGSKFPWEALVYAGLGILGGKSPHAGVNIGQGALQGLQLFENQRLREQQQAQLQFNQQQLHEDRVANRQIAQQRADQTGALQAARITALQFKQDHPNATLAQIQQAVMQDLMNNQGMTQSQAYTTIHNLDLPWAKLGAQQQHWSVTEGQGQQRIEQNAQRILQTQQAQQIAQQLKQQNADDANIRTVLNNAARRVAADYTGKLTFDQAVQEEMKAWPGGWKTSRPVPGAQPPAQQPAAGGSGSASFADQSIAKANAAIKQVMDGGGTPEQKQAAVAAIKKRLVDAGIQLAP